MSDVSKVLIGSIEGGFIVKVIGRGTMEFCSQLFDYLVTQIETKREKGHVKVYFDLSETSYMDSSFIGVIVSIDKRVKQITGSTVIVLNPAEKIKEILNTMGLLGLLPLEEHLKISNVNLSEEVHKKLAKDYDDIKLLLESHQNLMEISNENKKRFSLVEEMLRKELERNKNV